MHRLFYGCEPPHISEAMTENIKEIEDWFIDEKFSYVRVYVFSIPPHALPKFLPDRLVCREVAYQIVKGEIGIELKAAQKKLWPSFPVHIGNFVLHNHGHSKVEAEALEEVKLVNIEHKKHDPYQLVNRHMMHCSLKAYEHEKSIYDDMFKDVKSYEEVLNKVQALSSNLQAGFKSFQSHRRSCLPNILQGESTTSPSDQEEPPPGFETEVPRTEKMEVPWTEETEVPPTEETEVLRTDETESSKRKELEIPLDLPEDIPQKVGGIVSTKLGSPITSLTPLQSTFGNPSMDVLYVSDLEPISRDEIPSSNYFFSKKRKVVLKQEIHARGNTMIKKHRIIIDGRKLKDREFATKIAGTMGALASTNLYSFNNLRNSLRQKDELIVQLEDKLRETEKNISQEINNKLEQARFTDILEIQMLKENLSEANLKAQAFQA
jgi:hypothetical protein